MQKSIYTNKQNFVIMKSSFLILSRGDSNQTRDWFNLVKPYLTSEQIIIIEDVNLITPESIHLNSFMYEPLIDISDWTLRKLYLSVSSLLH